MTEDELQSEQEALEREHAQLRREHTAIEARAFDAAEHEQHGTRLRNHLTRLRAFHDALHVARGRGTG